MSLLGYKVPEFKTTSISKKGISYSSLKTSPYNKQVLIFYELNHSPTSYNAIKQFSERKTEFDDLNANIIFISCESVYCILNFLQHEDDTTYAELCNDSVCKKLPTNDSTNTSIVFQLKNKDEYKIELVPKLKPKYEIVSDYNLEINKALGFHCEDTGKFFYGFCIVGENDVIENISYSTKKIPFNVDEILRSVRNRYL